MCIRDSLWGSRRIGPDLSREGGKRTGLWHLEHFNNPPAKTEGSVMPSFAHLAVTKLDYDSIQERIALAGQLGTPYDQDRGPVDELAKVQARRIAWELAQLGGPMTVESAGGEELRVDENQTVALIA